MMSLHVICGLGPPLPIENPGYAYAFLFGVSTRNQSHFTVDLTVLIRTGKT